MTETIEIITTEQIGGIRKGTIFDAEKTEGFSYYWINFDGGSKFFIHEDQAIPLSECDYIPFAKVTVDADGEVQIHSPNGEIEKRYHSWVSHNNLYLWATIDQKTVDYFRKNYPFESGKVAVLGKYVPKEEKDGR